MTMTKTDLRSLETLGILIGDDKQFDKPETFEEICQEVCDRYDQDTDKLSVILTYHTKKFIDHASAKNWNELIALMGAVQHQQSKEEQGKGN